MSQIGESRGHFSVPSFFFIFFILPKFLSIVASVRTYKKLLFPIKKLAHTKGVSRSNFGDDLNVAFDSELVFVFSTFFF